jgi:hypothetical protein
MRTKILAALVVVGPALLLAPVERRIQAERKHLKYGGIPVTRQVREVIGQGTAMALLAGFRGVVADFLWIQSQTFWEKREWLRQYRNIELVTLLQPQSVLFWDVGQWHMAWNIAYGARTDPANRTEAAGIKREREWQERAREFLQRGIENIPHRYNLYFAMGWLYWQKFSKWQPEAYARAAEYFGRALAFPDAPLSIGRLYAHALEKAGRKRDAYAYWKMLWENKNQPHQAWNVVEREVKRLENELKIPENERVFLPSRP